MAATTNQPKHSELAYPRAFDRPTVGVFPPLRFGPVSLCHSVYARRVEFEQMFPFFLYPALVGFAENRVRIDDLYGLVRMDQTSKPNRPESSEIT